MSEDSLENSAQMLVNMREGSFQQKQLQVLPRRGNPPRIRRRNQRFYNDNEQTDYFTNRSPSKQSKAAPTSLRCGTLSKSLHSQSDDKSLATTPSNQLGERSLAVTLSNQSGCRSLVGTPSNYSGDRSLVVTPSKGLIITESFPQLKTKLINRVQWSKIRRLMGKPRRCSLSFFNEEREVLHARRTKIRLLQQQKHVNLCNIKDLPEEIPLHLVIGTEVTVRLRKPQDGLFTGRIEAVNTMDSTYRVTFDRPDLETHSIPDYEVLSINPVETIPVSAFQHKYRPRTSMNDVPMFVPDILNSPGGPLTEQNPLIGLDTQKMSLEQGTYGGFPIKFLVLVTQLSKMLNIKKDLISQLKEMNTKAEKMRSYQQCITAEFQQNYAHVVLELTQLNASLAHYLDSVHSYSQEFSPEHGLSLLEEVSEVKKRCDEEAEEFVTEMCQTMFHSRKAAKNKSVVRLVKGMTSLMLQIRTLSMSDFNSVEFRALHDSLSEIEGMLDPNNINAFQNNVEIHISHIQSGLSQMGNLHAFSSSTHDG